jgi:hypothetical protein
MRFFILLSLCLFLTSCPSRAPWDDSPTPRARKSSSGNRNGYYSNPRYQPTRVQSIGGSNDYQSSSSSNTTSSSGYQSSGKYVKMPKPVGHIDTDPVTHIQYVDTSE